MASNKTLIDGDFSRATEVGPPQWHFPFRTLGDNVSCYFDQENWQTDATWTQQEIASMHPSLRGFYLINESDRKASIANITSFVRTYARVPTDQVTYSSRSIAKPTIANQAASTLSVRSWNAATTEIATAVQNNTGYWLTDNRVFSPYKAQGSISANTASGGQMTFSYRGATTALLNYSDSGATIAAAINGLATVISDGITFGVTNSLTSSSPSGWVALTVSSATTFPVTMDASALTLSGAAYKKAYTTIMSSTAQSIALVLVVSSPSHGFTTSGALMSASFSTGFAYIFDSGYWEVYDANTLRVSPNISSGSISIPTAAYFAKYLRTYTPGAVVIAARTTEKYYLPGVTSGITTPADIPLAATYISDADVITAVLSGGTYKSVDFSGPEQWMGSAIWRTVTTEINFANL